MDYAEALSADFTDLRRFPFIVDPDVYQTDRRRGDAAMPNTRRTVEKRLGTDVGLFSTALRAFALPGRYAARRRSDRTIIENKSV